MKKPVEKRTVQMEVTADWIKGYGSNREIKRINKPYVVVWCGLLAALVVIAVLDRYTHKKYDIAFYVCIGGLLLSYIILWYKSIKAGNKLWDNIKNKEQPIKL